MLRKMILTPSVLVATAIAALATTSTASAGKLGCINPSDCGCELSSKEVDVEKSCFEVECKTICIPKVVFPWQTGHSCFGFGLFGCDKSACDSCDTPACDASGSAGKACDTSVHNGAFTKTIKVLSKKKYTEPGCEYVWSVKDKACDANCDSASAALPQQRKASVAERTIPQPTLHLAPVRVR